MRKSGSIPASLYHSGKTAYNENVTIKKTRNPVWAFAAVSALSVIGLMTNSVYPGSVYLVAIFIGLVSFFCFSLVRFLAVNTRQAVLFALFSAGVLSMRYLGLRQLIFTLLYAALILTIEWYLREP